MKIKARLYRPDLLNEPAPRLGPADHHYLVHVLRSEAGDGVVLFGLDSFEAVCEILTVSEGEVVLRQLERREVPTESPVDLTLAVAVGKGKKLEEIVEAVTALGVKRILPFVGRNSVAKLSNPRLPERLELLAREACRQCRRTTPPEISVILPSLKSVIDRLSPKQGSWVVFDEAGGESPSRIVRTTGSAGPWVLFCGPEGGWHPAERELFETQGAIRASLGPRILRTELAAIAAAAVFETLLAANDAGI